MFNVTGMTIELSVGDTGAIDFTSTGYTFASEDRAIFTVRTINGVEIIEEEHELTDGAFTQYFTNSDTDTYTAGNYLWDVRFVINPYRDGNGKIVDGDQVITPMTPQTLTLLPVVGEV